MTVELAGLLLGAYLLGAIPFGVIVARAHGVDIMSVGSGNTGATNVIRAAGKGPGLAVFFLDVLKGFLPAMAARWLFPDNQALWFLSGIVAVVGHSLSPFLKFRGGKGISTALGMAIGTSPLVALGAFVVVSTMLITTRFMSLSSMVATASTILFSFLLHDSLWVTGGFALLTVFVVIRHLPNIRRLRDRTEPKFSFKKTVGSEPDKKSEEEPEKDPEEKPDGDSNAP